MTPKVVITVAAVFNAIHGIAFVLTAGEMAKMGVPNISEDAFINGKGALEIAAMFNLFLASVLFFARSIDASSARKVAQGTGVGFILLFIGVVYHMMTLLPEQAPTMGAAVAFGLVTLWANYVAFIKKDEPTAQA